VSVARWDRSREPAPPRTFTPRPRPGAPGLFDVHVPPELEYFRGHFPEEPILAGIVQLDVLVLRQALELWPDLTTVARITRLRFRKPIRPGDDLVLSLVRPAPLRVDFEITCQGASCASGALHFREPPAP
jgi:3-hydroxymyristoyl/3-hydroxydecanoyl-(acyl carrier protein) dehydratase